MGAKVQLETLALDTPLDKAGGLHERRCVVVTKVFNISYTTFIFPPTNLPNCVLVSFQSTRLTTLHLLCHRHRWRLSNGESKLANAFLTNSLILPLAYGLHNLCPPAIEVTSSSSLLLHSLLCCTPWHQTTTLSLALLPITSTKSSS